MPPAGLYAAALRIVEPAIAPEELRDRLGPPLVQHGPRSWDYGLVHPPATSTSSQLHALLHSLDRSREQFASVCSHATCYIQLEDSFDGPMSSIRIAAESLAILARLKLRLHVRSYAQAVANSVTRPICARPMEFSTAFCVEHPRSSLGEIQGKLDLRLTEESPGWFWHEVAPEHIGALATDLDQLVRLLSARRDAVVWASSVADCSVNVSVFYYDKIATFSIDPKSSQALAELDLPLWLRIYPCDNDWSDEHAGF